MGVAEKQIIHTCISLSFSINYICVCTGVFEESNRERQWIIEWGEQKRRICMQLCLIFIGSFVRKAPELISSSRVLMDSLFGRRGNGSYSVIESRHRQKHIQPQPKTFSHVELAGIDKMKAECRFTTHIHDIYTL